MGMTMQSSIKLLPSHRTATNRTLLSQANWRGDSFGNDQVKSVINSDRVIDGYALTLTDIGANEREKTLRHGHRNVFFRLPIGGLTGSLQSVLAECLRASSFPRMNGFNPFQALWSDGHSGRGKGHHYNPVGHV